LAESYLDQGLEGWVDAHSAPHMAVRDANCAGLFRTGSGCSDRRSIGLSLKLKKHYFVWPEGIVCRLSPCSMGLQHLGSAYIRCRTLLSSVSAFRFIVPAPATESASDQRPSNCTKVLSSFFGAPKEGSLASHQRHWSSGGRQA